MTRRIISGIALAVFTATVCLAAGVPVPAQDAKPFVGDWKGAISVMGQNLEIVCHFSLDEAGAIKGTFDSPAQGAFGLALANFKIEGK